MKIIDKTPFQSEDGKIGLLDRLQLMLKFGMAFPKELEAQNVIIDALEKSLPRSSILLRNVTLPELEIRLPLILLCPAGIYLINTISEKGVYRARDREWGKIVGEQFAPTKINLIDRTARMARALQVFLDRKGFENILTVEPLLMATDPAIHVETTRPAVRVVMMDALERFAISMTQARAILTPEFAANITQFILTGKGQTVNATPALAQQPEVEEEPKETYSGNAFSFDDEEPEAETLAPALTFAFDDNEENNQGEEASLNSPALVRKSTKNNTSSAAKKGLFGFTNQQWGLLIGMLVIQLCLLFGFGLYIYFNG